MSEKLLPCPFCGEELIPNTNKNDLYVKRYGPYWSHPEGICFLSDYEVSPSEVTSWNLRAGPNLHG